MYFLLLNRRIHVYIFGHTSWHTIDMTQNVIYTCFLIQVDRLLTVAGKEEMTEFSHLFPQRTKQNLSDDHIWFSVVARPPQSRFTRVQRVSCCLFLLYTSMVANAMFYGVAATGPNKKVFSMGPFALTPEQVGLRLCSFSLQLLVLIDLYTWTGWSVMGDLTGKTSFFRFPP